MLKKDEMNNEPIFVLLARDDAAPQTIRYWIDERIRLGKNKRDDVQIVEAEQLAALMEKSTPVRHRCMKPNPAKF